MAARTAPRQSLAPNFTGLTEARFRAKLEAMIAQWSEISARYEEAVEALTPHDHSMTEPHLATRAEEIEGTYEHTLFIIARLNWLLARASCFSLIDRDRWNVLDLEAPALLAEAEDRFSSSPEGALILLETVPRETEDEKMRRTAVRIVKGVRERKNSAYKARREARRMHVAEQTAEYLTKYGMLPTSVTVPTDPFA